jgi:hypothetical protein
LPFAMCFFPVDEGKALRLVITSGLFFASFNASS